MFYDINFRLQLKPSSQLSALFYVINLFALKPSEKKLLDIKNNQWDVRWGDRERMNMWDFSQSNENW